LKKIQRLKKLGFLKSSEKTKHAKPETDGKETGNQSQ
jgi:hypothetical protein